jgi:3,4-dihydroxy 2-butanone 4-phosphate synthase/GTP cyclohydrolase II
MIQASLERIAAEKCGVFVYLHQTGMGNRHHHQQTAPLHETGIGAQILADLGLSTIRLLTNHPRKVLGLDAFGIEIVEQIPLEKRP